MRPPRFFFLHNAGFPLCGDPEVAIISCAEVNDYGHPHRETMASLTEYGCRILQTWEVGTVCVVTDGEAYDVYTWSEGAGLLPAA